LTIAGVDIPGLTNLETDLVGHYSLESQASFADASATTNLLGDGVGSNTNEAQPFVKEGMIKGVENYYAKIIIELGVFGLVVVSSTHFILIYLGMQNHYNLRGTDLRDYVDAITALLILTVIYDAKGQALDFDPLNMLYWLFGGIMIRLPSLCAAVYQNSRTQYSYELDDPSPNQAF
jgi:hypothetical protein